MAENNDCIYCSRNEKQKELMIEICDLNVSTVFLFKEQSYKGRCIVAHKNHAKELYELQDEDLLHFMEDVNQVARAMKEMYNPAKINYGAYSDTLPHLHIHLCPKYKGENDFGSTFVMNPGKVYLSDKEYADMVNTLKSKLK